MRKGITAQGIILITHCRVQKLSMGLFDKIHPYRSTSYFGRHVIIEEPGRPRIITGNNASRNTPGYNSDQPGLFQHMQMMPDSPGGCAQALRNLLGSEWLILNNPQDTRANHIADRLELLFGRNSQANGNLWHNNGNVVWQQW